MITRVKPCFVGVFFLAFFFLTGCNSTSPPPSDTTLGFLDWAVLVFYVAAMLGIGAYYSLQNKTERDFFLGGGKMNPIALGLSLFATITSSLSYLAWPGETILYGPVILSGAISFPLVHYVVGWLLIPRFKSMNVTSAYEILEIKLGLSVRMLATFFFLSLRFLWMATIIYVSVDVVILSLFGIDPSYRLLIGASLMVITIIYTFMGGIKGVVVTDVVQTIILLGGAVVVIAVVSIYFGSVTAWLPDHWLPQWGDMKLGINPQDRSSIGSAILMTFIWYVATAGSDQMAIQRFLASEDVGSARRAFGVSLIAGFLGMVLLSLVGFALLSYFTVNPGLLSEGTSLAEEADVLFPKFIITVLPDGISGLLVASILSAAMSSLSSGLNATATVITEDIIKRFISKARQSVNDLRQAKALSLFVGVATLILSTAIPYVDGNLIDLSIKVVNLFVAPLFVLFFLALFIPFATARGTFIGGVASTLVAIILSFVGLMGIEVFFIIIISLLTGIGTGIIFSFIDYRFFGNRKLPL